MAFAMLCQLFLSIHRLLSFIKNYHLIFDYENDRYSQLQWPQTTSKSHSSLLPDDLPLMESPPLSVKRSDTFLNSRNSNDMVRWHTGMRWVGWLSSSFILSQSKSWYRRRRLYSGRSNSMREVLRRREEESGWVHTQTTVCYTPHSCPIACASIFMANH